MDLTPEGVFYVVLGWYWDGYLEYYEVDSGRVKTFETREDAVCYRMELKQYPEIDLTALEEVPRTTGDPTWLLFMISLPNKAGVLVRVYDGYKHAFESEDDLEKFWRKHAWDPLPPANNSQVTLPYYVKTPTTFVKKTE